MESELLNYLMDYGLAFVVMGGGLFWVGKVLHNKMNKAQETIEVNSTDIKENTKAIQENNKGIEMLAQAITALTNNTSQLYKTCERAFEDNRETVQILLKHIQNKE